MNHTRAARAGQIGRLIAMLVVAGLAAASAVAQPPSDGRGGGFGRGPGGFGGRGGFVVGFRDPASLSGQLRNDDVQEDLGLSEEQREQIGEIRPDFQAMAPLFQRLREASEEERAQIQAEIRELQQKQEAETEAAVRKVLSPEQMTKLLGVVYREAGPRALVRPEVADELKLTEEQRDQLRRLNEERATAFRDLGFRVSEEDRKKFDEEWNAKLTAVLTPGQQQQWQTKVASSGGADGDAAPANAVSPAVAAGTGPARPALTDRPGSRVRYANGASSDEVVASFEAPRGNSAASASDDPYDPTMLSFNFQNAPWYDVLELFARTAGYTLDALDNPPGTFTYKDNKTYTPLKALDVLHGYLLQRGHVMVYRDKFMVVLNIDNRPIPPNLVPKITLAELEELHAQGIQNQLVQVFVPLEQGLDAEQVATQIEGLLGPQRQVVGLKAANALSIRDTVSHISNLRDVLERMTVPPNPEAIVIRSFPLKHIVASEAEPHVRALFGLGSATPNVSSAARDSRFRGFQGFGGGWPGFGGDRGRDRDRDDRDSRSQPQAVAAPVQVTADRRTNTLLVAATPTQLDAVDEMLKSIDVPVPDGVAGLVGSNTPEFRVYRVDEAEADEVAQTLTALMPHVVINDDDQRGRGFVHINATPLEHQKVAEWIRLMNGGGGAGGQSIDIIRIGSRYEPYAVASMLNQMFISDGENAPTIQGEATTRSLMVKGSPEQIILVRQTVSRMGLEGSSDSVATSGGTGRFRPVATLGRDPEKIARRLREILERTGEFENRVNIIVPASDSDRDRLREEEPGAPRIRLETTVEPADEFRRLDPRLNPDRNQTSTNERRGSADVRRESPDAAEYTTEDLPPSRRDSRSNRSPAQETRPLQGITPRDFGPLTSFDVPQPSGNVEVDLVPGTGILILKGAQRDLNALGATTGSAEPPRSSRRPHPLATGAQIDGNVPAQFVSLVQEPASAAESEPAAAQPAVQPAETDLGGVLNDLSELLDLEDLAEQERNAGERPAPAPGSSERRGAEPAAEPEPQRRAAQADPQEDGQASGTPSGASKPGVTIEVQGGKLYIYSADEDALDQVESAIADLLNEMPPETVWTVFYLRTADVLDAADMLTQLMPDTTVASMSSASGGGMLGNLSGGISSMTSGLMSMTGLDTLGTGPMTLRIIPDLRSNSLWVSGPVDKVRDVKAFLERLDADELPESLRDRVPRTIDVYYANIHKVADIIRELYKDYLEDPNQRRNQGNNPLAMFMGGGGGSSGGRASGIRLTLAIDETTNQLIVSCSNSLYEQIRRTVEVQDLAAQEARMTVRFLSVDASSSSVIQETLSRALPNVRVSTTGTPADRRTAATQQRTASQPSGGGSDRGGDRGGGDEDRERAERIRQYMERQRSQSGDSGGDRGGSSRSFGGDRGGDRGGSSSFGRGSFGGGGFPGGGFGGFGGRGSDGDRRGR